MRVTDTTYTTDLVISKSQTSKHVLAAPNDANGAPTWRALVASDVGLGSVSNNANLNSATGTKGDIIYWSGANAPAHLTNTNSTTKHFLSITSQVPTWTTLSKSDVGLGNVENKALSTWTGSNTITTVGTIGTGTWQGTAIAATYIGNHSTDKLTSGTLGVARGGTGIATATYKNAIIAGNASTVTSAFQAIRTNNGAFYATAQDGAPSFGTLPIAQGGTGATSAGEARCNLEEGNYLSCTTAGDVANKTVAYPGFSLKNGIVINITFTNQNTIDINTPTLNVENTEAKEIRCNGTAVKRQGLAAGYLYRLLYDGTYWQVLNPRIDFIGTCITAGNSSNKVVEIPGFVPYPGAKVSIIFQNNNSYRGIINLNINGYGNKPVYNFGHSQVTTWYTFNAGQSYEFVYNGTNYYVVNNSFRRDIVLGVTQTDTVSQVHGTDYLYLGNNLTSTTDNGLTGGLRLYSASTSYITLSASKHTDSTKNPFWYFPNMDSTARYFISSNSTSAIGSATQPVYITTNGKVVACTNTLDLVYPVGSIYITVNDIDLTSAQNIVFPGTTWSRFGVGRMLIGTDVNTEVNTTGGNSSITLTHSNIPSHQHLIPDLTTDTKGGHQHKGYYRYEYFPGGSSAKGYLIGYESGVSNTSNNITQSSGGHSHTISGYVTGATGGDSDVEGNPTVAFDITNPYIKVYMWKRET